MPEQRRPKKRKRAASEYADEDFDSGFKASLNRARESSTAASKRNAKLSKRARLESGAEFDEMDGHLTDQDERRRASAAAEEPEPFESSGESGSESESEDEPEPEPKASKRKGQKKDKSAKSGGESKGAGFTELLHDNESARRLKEFNPRNEDLLYDNSVNIIYGTKGSGKTTYLRALLFAARKRYKNHEVVLISPTADINEEQYDWLPEGDLSRITNLTDAAGRLEEIREEQIAKIKEAKTGDGAGKGAKGKKGAKISRAGQSSDSARKLLLIFDDCVSEEFIRHSPIMKQLVISARHLNITMFIMSQCVCGSGSVPPAIRVNANTITVVAHPPQSTERKLLKVAYMSRLPKMEKAADELISGVTAVEYRAMVIHATNNRARTFPEYIYRYGPVEPELPESHEGWVLGKPYADMAGDSSDDFSESDSDDGDAMPQGLGKNGQVDSSMMKRRFRDSARAGVHNDLTRESRVLGAIPKFGKNSSRSRMRRALMPSIWDNLQTMDFSATRVMDDMGLDFKKKKLRKAR